MVMMSDDNDNGHRFGDDPVPPLQQQHQQLVPDDGEPSFWQVWLVRILVTAAIVLVMELLGRMATMKQGPSPTKQQQQQEDDDDKTTKGVFATLQYTDLSATDQNTVTDDGIVSVETNDGEDKRSREETTTKDGDMDEAQQPAESEYGVADDNDKNGTTEVVDEPCNEEADEVVSPEKHDENREPSSESSSSNDEEADKTSDKNETKTTNINNKNNNDTTTTTTETTEEEEVPATTDHANNNTTTIKFNNKSSHHPGMDGFHHWYDIETSLFRQYNVGRTDGVDVLPPYVPKSRNGQVRVALRVTNQLTDSRANEVIKVYWMNYMGHEEYKGSILRGETWTQTTYVEHPWVFRLGDRRNNLTDTTMEPQEEKLLLHYIPERVIPHLDDVPTIEDDHPMVGVQRFVFLPPNDHAQRDCHICTIDDKVMPHPARHHFHQPDQAHTWTLQQMRRLEYFDYHPEATLLVKYLTNIAMHPDKAQYRQIRIANRKFYSGIWQTSARGLLLAAGFVEQRAFCELGTADVLSSGGVQDVSLVLFRIQQCLTRLEQTNNTTAGASQQPDGADGSGRAGFGRAGQMNFRS